MNSDFVIPLAYLPHLLLGIYLLIVNVITLFLMGIDKRCAIRDRRRIPESRLFLFAAIGGAIGSLIGMYAFHHKTRHMKFVIGMPLILVLQLVLAGLLVYLVNFV